MANILINGFSAKTGGGKAIFENYLSLLAATNASSEDQCFVLTPDHLAYSQWNKGHIHIVSIPLLYHRTVLFLPLFYLVYLPRLVTRLNISVILNFGDIGLPVRIAQVYFFDWPYAVYPESIVWKRMKMADYLARKLKLWIITRTLKYATVIIAQIPTMARRLGDLYGLKNIVSIPSPVTLESQRECAADFSLPAGRRLLLCLANHAPHKNIDILLPLAKLLRSKNSDFTIVTTLDPAQSKASRRFLREIESAGLNEYLVNIGQVDRSQVASLLQQCQALLLPTLLESYGLPFVEAMFARGTILTSDFEFTRDVCGDAAYYFDPLDECSIYAAICTAFSDEAARNEKIAHGSALVERLISWPEAFSAYQGCIATAREVFL